MINSVIREDQEPNLSWDTGDIFQKEVEHLMEEDGHTEEYAREIVSNNPELNEFEWECFVDSLTELMREVRDNRSHYWHATVENFGWNNQYGEKVFEAILGEDLLGAVLPACDCTYHVYKVDGYILIQNFHHDSPTGNEWYLLEPKKKGEIDD